VAKGRMATNRIPGCQFLGPFSIRVGSRAELPGYSIGVVTSRGDVVCVPLLGV
jgi:hypothetical protein